MTAHLLSSGLTNSIYLARRVKPLGNGNVEVVGPKEDITDQAIAAVIGHAKVCELKECRCKELAQFRPASGRVLA